MSPCQTEAARINVQIRNSRSAHWERIEQAAQGTPHSPSQALFELAMEALDRRQWPGTDFEMRVARAWLLTALAIAGQLIVDRREAEIQAICDFISTIEPDSDARTVYPHRHICDNRVATTSFSIHVPLEIAR